MTLFDETSEIPGIFYRTSSRDMNPSFKALVVLVFAAVSVIAETHSIQFDNRSVRAPIISKGHHRH